MSTFELKKTEALRILETTGIRRSNYLPPATKMLWRLGFEVPPPHFIAFGTVVLFYGIYFSLFWGICMYVLNALGAFSPISPISKFAVACIVSGLLFGLTMAAYYAYGRRKHRLPSWDALGEKQGVA